MKSVFALLLLCLLVEPAAAQFMSNVPPEVRECMNEAYRKQYPSDAARNADIQKCVDAKRKPAAAPQPRPSKPAVSGSIPPGAAAAGKFESFMDRKPPAAPAAKPSASAPKPAVAATKPSTEVPKKTQSVAGKIQSECQAELAGKNLAAAQYKTALYECGARHMKLSQDVARQCHAQIDGKKLPAKEADALVMACMAARAKRP